MIPKSTASFHSLVYLCHDTWKTAAGGIDCRVTQCVERLSTPSRNVLLGVLSIPNYWVGYIQDTWASEMCVYQTLPRPVVASPSQSVLRNQVQVAAAWWIGRILIGLSWEHWEGVRGGLEDVFIVHMVRQLACAFHMPE